MYGIRRRRRLTATGPAGSFATLILRLNGSVALDPAITFTRASLKWYRRQDGLLDIVSNDTPAFEYDNDGTALGMSIEPAATNLAIWSEEFDNAAWTKDASVTVTPNTTTAPDGATTADTIATSAGNGDKVLDNAGVTAAAQVCFSVWVKNIDASTSRISLRDSTNTTNIGDANLVWSGPILTAVNDGPTVPDDKGFEPWANGWYRVWVVATMGVGGISAQYRIAPETSASAAEIYAFGADFNEGDFQVGALPDSYIMTTTGAKVRQADVAEMTGTNFSDWYNASEGTLFVDWRITDRNPAITHKAASISDGTDAERMLHRLSAAGQLGGLIRDNAVNQAIFTLGTPTFPVDVRSVLAYKLNNSNMAVNGTLGTLDLSCTIPTVDKLNIGSGRAGTEQIIGNIKRVVYWPERLPDSQIEYLSVNS